jgi:hypothetical protein
MYDKSPARPDVGIGRYAHVTVNVMTEAYMSDGGPVVDTFQDADISRRSGDYPILNWLRIRDMYQGVSSCITRFASVLLLR